MFNFLSVNTAEVNAGIRAPDAPVLSIVPAEDTNTLTWNSPYFADFFTVYWSDNEFTSIDEPGVHAITSDIPAPGLDPSVNVSYIHTIPAAFSLSVLYYRIGASNRFGSSLSNQVDNYNFKLAIYEEIYKKTIDDVTLRFTPEIRKQYEDSILWRSFVQSLCSELAQSRFEIKEALKQLNIQKAVDVFLNMWYGVTGIARINVLNNDSGEMELENDAQYRQRLVDNVFWDKISNLALKKTLLLKLQIDGTVLDTGTDVSVFRNVPTRDAARYIASYASMFIPGEHVAFLFWGPNGDSICVSDTGTSTSSGTLTYSNQSGTFGTPYSYFGVTSWMYANPIGAPSGTPNGTALHEAVLNPFSAEDNPGFLAIPWFRLGVTGDPLIFHTSGATGTLEASGGGYISFKLTPGSAYPVLYDVVENQLSYERFILSSPTTELTAAGPIPINSKLLSNIYSVNLGVSTMSDADLNDIYEEIFPLAALGNVLIKILQDTAASFNDWDATLGNIPYGAIFMGAEPYSLSLTISTETNWSVGQTRYMDNQWTTSSGKTFYGNDGPDDIVILTRTS